MTTTSTPGTFVTFQGDRHSEVARNLAEPVPQALSALDQLGLWGNLGVSLLGFTGAIFVLQPGGAGTPKLSLAVARSGNIYGAFIALPAGAIGFGILALRELDQPFANVYSTAASTQNLRPLWDRRVLAIVISAVTTAGALFLNISDYENFLILLGLVFVPMSAVLIVDLRLPIHRRGAARGERGAAAA